MNTPRGMHGMPIGRGLRSVFVTSYRILHGEVANPHAETLAEALPG